MHSNIYKALSRHIKLGPKFVDSLILSSYLAYHDLKVSQNQVLLRNTISIDSNTQASEALRDFLKVISDHTEDYTIEDLIELFEFVVSPSEKIVNGAVYTPVYIRDFIIDSLLGQTERPATACTLYDPACGCGGFLLTFSSRIKTTTGRTFQEIYKEQIFGVDIADYSLQRASILLSLQALIAGEDLDFDFNLVVGNSLIFNPTERFNSVKEAGGFDLVAGNPPYVASRNMDEITLQQTLAWSVSKSGHPDLYIPFFQIGINVLNPTGLLGYITVNTFIKSVNGRALRQYFEDANLGLTVINFGGEQVFAERNTYTCICIISRLEPGIKYIRTTSDKLGKINELPFKSFAYNRLNHTDGWNLVNSEELAVFIKNIEGIGKSFKDLYVTKNGIATLKNDVYKFKPTREDRLYYYLPEPNQDFKIEKSICRNIVNANKIKQVEDIQRLNEKIIFPYKSQKQNLKIISEPEMISSFPETYRYLKSKKKLLATRDRGKGEYEEWYAYGRRQSMDIHAYKLFFPHICERPSFVLCDEQELLFYNGIAVISNNREDLEILKKILESDIFYKYIKSTTKDYSSGYISLSRNYLKNFGVYQFTNSQKKDLLKAKNSEIFLKKFYQV